jgi:hypothetical protein
MKGLLSPAVLVHIHNLTTKQVAHIYQLLFTFSFAFHGQVQFIAEQATQSNSLKENVWRAFAELWQAALGLQFSAEITRLMQERDAALCALAQELAAKDKNSSDKVEQRCAGTV